MDLIPRVTFNSETVLLTAKFRHLSEHCVLIYPQLEVNPSLVANRAVVGVVAVRRMMGIEAHQVSAG